MTDQTTTRTHDIAALAKKRILILDGAMGTVIQQHRLDVLLGGGPQKQKKRRPAPTPTGEVTPPVTPSPARGRLRSRAVPA